MTTTASKHEFVDTGRGDSSPAKKARKTLDRIVKEYVADRSLQRPMVVRRVDPAELVANGGVVPRATISKPTPYRVA